MLKFARGDEPRAGKAPVDGAPLSSSGHQHGHTTLPDDFARPGSKRYSKRKSSGTRNTERSTQEFVRTETFVHRSGGTQTFPSFEVTDTTDSVTLPGLEKFLQDRIDKHKNRYHTLKEEEKDFHHQLRDFLRYSQSIRTENDALKVLLRNKERRAADLRARIQEKLDLQHHLIKNSTLREHEKLHLFTELRDREQQCSQEETNRQSFKNRLKGTSRKQHQSRERTFEEQLRQTESALSSRIERQENRLKRLQEALLPEGSSNGLIPSAPVESSSGASTMTRERRIPVVIDRTLNYSRSRQIGPRTASNSPSIPFHNPRHGRRSKSHDAVLEHRSPHRAPLGTRFKLTYGPFERRKSVSKLKVTHALNSDKYVLEDQKANSHGHIETRVFKGDFVPTAGGGRSMIFRDVEVLQQENPVPVAETVPSSLPGAKKGKTVLVREVVTEKFSKNSKQ